VALLDASIASFHAWVELTNFSDADCAAEIADAVLRNDAPIFAPAAVPTLSSFASSSLRPNADALDSSIACVCSFEPSSRLAEAAMAAFA
jgi:hypothetical protein